MLCKWRSIFASGYPTIELHATITPLTFQDFPMFSTPLITIKAGKSAPDYAVHDAKKSQK